MDAPAQTVQYFIAGYVVIFLGLLGYVFSLNYRWKKLFTEKNYLSKDRQVITTVLTGEGED